MVNGNDISSCAATTYKYKNLKRTICQDFTALNLKMSHSVRNYRDKKNDGNKNSPGTWYEIY